MNNEKAADGEQMEAGVWKCADSTALSSLGRRGSDAGRDNAGASEGTRRAGMQRGHGASRGGRVPPTAEFRPTRQTGGVAPSSPPHIAAPNCHPSSPPRVKARLVALISTSWRGSRADPASRGSLTARCRLPMLHASTTARPPSLEMGP